MRLVFINIFLLVHIYLIGQEYKVSDILFVPKFGELKQLSDNQENWDVVFKSYAPSQNKSDVSDEVMDSIKDAVKRKFNPVEVNRDRNEAPRMNLNFEGNRTDGGVPPDNTIAVSDNGFIVSSINSNILFTRADNKQTIRKGLSDFFKDLKLPGGYFDPKILFDPEEKKFIVIALSGNLAVNSHVVIAFSKTEDPYFGWNFYKIKGDVNNEKLWFDYPSVGITNKELFINGNLFTEQPYSFRYSAILQINKHDGFSGKPLRIKAYSKLKAPTGQNYFNLTPINHGWNKNLVDKMYFLTNDNRGGNIIALCEITGPIETDPQFKTSAVANSVRYDVSPQGPQKGIAKLMQTGDCRIQYGILLNNVIHFVFKALANDEGGIYYGRFDLSNYKLYSSFYAEAGSVVSYPSISAFGNSEEDPRVLINFLRTSASTFPGQAAVVCSGIGKNFIYTNSTTIKEGTSFINVLEEAQRWGDYSATCRRFNPTGIRETWISGCYGRGSFGSHTAQFIGEESNYRDFFADKTVINLGDSINIFYLGTDTLTDIYYVAEAGQAMGSFNKFKYDSLGSFDLTLFGMDASGNEISILKKDFIHVVPVKVAPVANFEASKTEIFVGDTILFTDISLNDPERWSWTFSNGTPATSENQNPRVTYKKAGKFNVILVATNPAGEDAEVKLKYITVSEKPLPPQAGFKVSINDIKIGDTITLTDESKNQPNKWRWIISHAESTIPPDTFTTQNVEYVGKEKGSYHLSLKVENISGTDSLFKKNAFTVGLVSTQDEISLSSINVFPNPSMNERTTVSFDLMEPQYLGFQLYNERGQLIKSLIEKYGRVGRNELSFNTDSLATGKYYIRVNDKQGRKLSLIPLIIVK